MRRERIRHDPLDALREAIVDALAHRGWTRYEEIEVFRCADRIEIPSPGALQNSMTIEKMGAGQRSPGNLPVSDVVRDYNDADSRGMGVRHKGVRNKIIPLLREQNGVAPEFTATHDSLKLTMRRGSATG